MVRLVDPIRIRKVYLPAANGPPLDRETHGSRNRASTKRSRSIGEPAVFYTEGSEAGMRFRWSSTSGCWRPGE